jgi:hypothetical protein
MWSGVYNTDGTVKWDNGSSGTWRVDGDKYCDHPGRPGILSHDLQDWQIGDKKYQFYRPDGSKAAVLTIE